MRPEKIANNINNSEQQVECIQNNKEKKIVDSPQIGIWTIAEAKTHTALNNNHYKFIETFLATESSNFFPICYYYFM